ncbi:MAG: YfhO family protein [Firmicutes bacterium]|nr:YfhO family protein [[Eubacterium] siraeum]MCM1487882.1 YfhO family protein [Bacillota bacterium]
MEALMEAPLKRGKAAGGRIPYWLKAFFLALILGAAAFVPHFIMGNGAFVLSNDYGALFVPQSMFISDVLKSGNLFWNWSMDLGGNFIESMGISSVYVLILSLFPTSLIPYVMPWITVLRMGVSALTASLYLKRYLKHDITVTACSLMYAFSGFQIVSVMYYTFADFISVFPLMLLGLELLVEEKRQGFLLLASVLNLACSGLTVFYGEVIFLIIYFAMKYFNKEMLRDNKVLFSKLKDILSCIVEGALGILCMGIAVVPSLLNLLSNSRISQHISTSGWFTVTTANWLQTVRAFMLPAEPMNSGAAIESYNWYSVAAYLPVVGMLLVTAYLMKKHNWKSRLVKLLLVMAVVPLFSSVFMEFSWEPYRRWYYMFVLILALVSGKVLDEMQDYPIYNALALNVGILLTYYIMVIALPWNEGTDKNLIYQKPVFLLNMAIAAAGLAVCVICYRKKLKKTLPIVLAAVMLFGSGLTFLHLGEHHYTVDDVVSYDTYDFNSYDKTYYENVLAFITETTEDLPKDVLPYRYSFEDYAGYSYYNQAFVRGLPSINSFLTTAHGSVTEFYESIGMSRKNMTPEIDNIGKTLLGAKYIVSTGDKTKSNTMIFGSVTSETLEMQEEMLEEIKYEFKSVGQKTLGSGQEIYLYENENALPIGFAQDKYLRKSEFDLLGAEYKTAAMINALIIRDEDEETVSQILPHQEGCVYADLVENIKEVYEEKRKESSAEFEQGDNYFSSVIETEEERYVFFSVPFDKYWNAEVNGESVEILNTNGLMAVPVPKGSSKIVFRFEYPVLKYAAAVSAIGIVLSALYILIAVRVRRKNGGASALPSEEQELPPEGKQLVLQDYIRKSPQDNAEEAPQDNMRENTQEILRENSRINTQDKQEDDHDPL